MSDHAWGQEHIACYIAGGLDAEERSRFEEHLIDCPDCAKALDETQHLDRTLESLFADARPRPGLEDRMIRHLRAAPRRLPIIQSTHVRWLMAAAAVLFLGIFGAAMSAIVETGQLPFPGMADLSPQRSKAMGNPNAAARAEAMAVETRSLDEGLNAEYTRRTTTLDMGDKPADSDGDRVKSVKELAEEMRRESFHGLRSDGRYAPGKDKNLENDEIGRDPDMPKNYYVDRVRDVSVPGPVAGNEPVGSAPKMPAPAGLGYRQGQGGGGGGFGGADGYWKSQPVLTVRPGDQAGRDEEKKRKSSGGKEDAYYTYRNNDPAAPSKPQADSFAGRNSGEGKVTSGPSGSAPQPPRPAEQPLEKKEAPPEPKAEPKPDPKPEPIANPKGGDPKEPPKSADEPPPVTQRKIIRQGDMEFEVDSFDAAVAQITKIAAEERGFIATVNSDKLPNGKTRGNIIVRCPPDRLDLLILKLRALGELKSQRISSQDVTKMYTDMESRLRAARAMEERLLKIIKEGQGAIKDLLTAEKELGVWREKIETLEGEIRFYNNLISLSTLTITLIEREISSAFGITETERVQMGIEVEDVDKAQREAHTAITEAKGRITKSELKQTSADSFQGIIHCECAPEAAGPLRDRLRQLGEVSRLDVGRSQSVEGGSTRPVQAKVQRNDVQFIISLYNVATVTAKETVHLSLASADPEDSYKKILSRVGKSSGRIVTHNLDRQRNDQTRGTIHFEVKTAEAEAVLTDCKGAGEVEVMRLNVVEVPDGTNVTRSKRRFQVELYSVAAVRPRETINMDLAVPDTAIAYNALQDVVKEAKGRVLHANLDERNKQDIKAEVHFDVPRSELAAIEKAVGGAGEVLTRQGVRAEDKQSNEFLDSKVGFRVNMVNLGSIKPRETAMIRLATRDVPAGYKVLQDAVAAAQGRMILAQLNEQDRQNIHAQVDCEIRRGELPVFEKELAKAGDVHSRNATRALDTERTTDSKVFLKLSLIDVANIPPRQTYTAIVQVSDVDKIAGGMAAVLTENHARSPRQTFSQDPNGTKNLRLRFDAPLANAPALLAKMRGAGLVLQERTIEDPDVPETPLAMVRFDVALSNEAPILAKDEGVWNSVRTALSYSFKFLFMSLSWVVFGLCVIGPWGVIGYGVYRVATRNRRKVEEPPTATPVP
jgi:anti-sigma factor RsiW